MAYAETATRPEVHIVPWWLTLLEGIAAIIIGIMFFTAPGSTVLFLVQVVGWYWLISGIFSLVSMFIDHHQWGWKLFAGILGIIAGLIIIQNPLWSAFVLPAVFLTLLGIGGIVIGVIKLIQAFSGEGWGVGILGALSILFGLLLLFRPTFGAALFLIVFPIVAIVGGIVAIIAAFQVRSIDRRVEQGYVPAPAPSAPSTASAVPVTGEQAEESMPHEPDEPSAPVTGDYPQENEPHEPDEPSAPPR